MTRPTTHDRILEILRNAGTTSSRDLGVMLGLEARDVSSACNRMFKEGRLQKIQRVEKRRSQFHGGQLKRGVFNYWAVAE